MDNHPDPRSTLFYAVPTTPLKIKERIDGLLNDPNVVLFTICRKDDGQLVGKAAFIRIDWVGRMAIFYIGIADKVNWSKGYGSECTELMVEYALSGVGLGMSFFSKKSDHCF